MHHLKIIISGGKYYVYARQSEFVFLNGSAIKGPNLPTSRIRHCMVTLDDGKVMVLGGDRYTSKRVSLFDPQTSTFTNGSDLLYEREYAGCTVFKSPLHDNRPVVLAAGGRNQATAEVLDYTKTNAWEESKKATYILT